MTTWTNITKASGTTYTNVADPVTTYTNVQKPTLDYTLKAGMTMGLLIPLTNAVARGTDQTWTDVPKAT